MRVAELRMLITIYTKGAADNSACGNRTREPPALLQRNIHAIYTGIRHFANRQFPDTLSRRPPVPRERRLRHPRMRLVLYEPDIPQNTGAVMRLAACLGVGVDVIEPCGFVLDDRRLRRAGMDYLDLLDWQRWSGWTAYCAAGQAGRLVLLTTRGDVRHPEFAFRADDRLLLGRESAGVPDAVHAAADARVAVPLRPGARSLNVALAAALVLGEALRQTGGFPA